MTIDELLIEGSRSMHLAIKAADNEIMLVANAHAAIAQACATLAQAMMLAQMTTGMNVNLDEEVRLLRVDIGI